MPALKWRPRFTYGPGSTVLSLAWPCGRWVPLEHGQGGSATADSGEVEAMQIRRDHLMRIPIRFHDTEWAALAAMLEWAQSSGQSLTFRFDQDRADTEYVVYLEEPRMGERLEPRPDAQAYGRWELEIVIRRVAGGPFAVGHFS